jgi:hypothetical protein
MIIGIFINKNFSLPEKLGFSLIVKNAPYNKNTALKTESVGEYASGFEPSVCIIGAFFFNSGFPAKL